MKTSVELDAEFSQKQKSPPIWQEGAMQTAGIEPAK